MGISQGGDQSATSLPLYLRKERTCSWFPKQPVHKSGSLLCPTDHRRSFETKTFRTVLRNKTSPRKGQTSQTCRTRGPTLPWTRLTEGLSSPAKPSSYSIYIHFYLYMGCLPLHLCFLTSALCRREHLWSQIIFNSCAI